MSKTVTIKLVRSQIGATPRVKATLKALGLGKINSQVEKPNNPEVQGMIKRVSHLVEVTEK